MGVNNINLKINETIELPAMSGMNIIVQAPPFSTTQQDWLVEATQPETHLLWPML